MTTTAASASCALPVRFDVVLPAVADRHGVVTVRGHEIGKVWRIPTPKGAEANPAGEWAWATAGDLRLNLVDGRARTPRAAVAALTRARFGVGGAR